VTSDGANTPWGRFEFFDFEPDVADMREEVLAGLCTQPKHLPPKYFYDDEGSKLFETITQLPEYYLTRTELSLFDEHLDELASALGHGACLVEYGSGSSLKIRKLLRRARPAAYVPVDISAGHLLAQSRALHRDHPWLDVFPACADFTSAFPLPEPVRELPRVGFFPGSSIGNFDAAGAVTFLRSVRTTLGFGARLLVGVDRKKCRSVLEAAYNDAAGVTARFNLNMLANVNRRLGADFDLDAFAHEARYDEPAGCIRMFLRSRVDQQVSVGGEAIAFAAGERIHTENSYKYDPHEFAGLAARGGFEVERMWTDDDAWFALFLLQACDA
jgi:dimethylhistidine N-methyltransferase